MKTLPQYILILLAGSFLLHATQDQTKSYRDPVARFTVTAPSGWKMQPLGDGVQIVRGDDYASVMIFEHSPDAKAVIDDVAAHIGKKWRRFEMVKNGNSTLSGRPSAFESFSGVNPEGVEAELKLECVVADGVAYVLVSGYPLKDAAKAQDPLNQIQHSFALLQHRAESTPAPSAPTVGIEATDLTPEDATMYHLDHPTGALVIDLNQSGPAAKSGLQLHDVILAIDGTALDGAAMLERVIASHKPGDVIEVQLCRMENESKIVSKTLNVTLGANTR